MARSRNIKPGFFDNEHLAQLDPYARLLFIGLWTLADREGRLEDRPARIKKHLFGYEEVTPEQVDSWLDELHSSPEKFIIRYQVAPEHSGTSTVQEGCEYYIQITNWPKHQNPHMNEKPSIIPAYDPSTVQAPEHSGTSTVQAPEQHGTNRDDSLFSDSLNSDSRGGEDSLSTVLPPSNSYTPLPPGGYDPNDESRSAATRTVRALEEMFCIYPFTPKQTANGTQAKTMAELESICRLVSPDEITAIVKREYERKIKESKGTDRPSNLPYYMKVIKDAFFAKDRQLEEAERRRDEEKKRRKRDPADDPVPIAALIEEELTEEDKTKLKERFGEVKQKIAKSRGSVRFEKRR